MLLLSERSIARVLKEKGINTRRKNRYTLNEYYFENIDTEAKAYILGFIYADGSVILSKNTSYHKVNGTVKKYEYKSFLFEILGTEKFLININSFMRLKYYKIKDTRTEQIKTLVCSSKKESKNIYNYLYNNSTIYLNRKYDKWNYILSAFAK